jgi:hypothetical protein
VLVDRYLVEVDTFAVLGHWPSIVNDRDPNSTPDHCLSNTFEQRVLTHTAVEVDHREG